MRRYFTASTIACALCGAWWLLALIVPARAETLPCSDVSPTNLADALDSEWKDRSTEVMDVFSIIDGSTVSPKSAGVCLAHLRTTAGDIIVEFTFNQTQLGGGRPSAYYHWIDIVPTQSKAIHSTRRN